MTSVERVWVVMMDQWWWRGGRGDESGPAVWSFGGGGLVARRVRGDADGWLWVTLLTLP